MTPVLDFHPPQLRVSQGKGSNGRRKKKLHVFSDGCSYAPRWCEVVQMYAGVLNWDCIYVFFC